MRPASDFQARAAALNEQGVSRWRIGRCSICHYAIGYIFRGDDVYFDAGCNCTSGSELEPRSWQDVADHYNLQRALQVMAEMDRFWGFDAQE